MAKTPKPTSELKNWNRIWDNSHGKQYGVILRSPQGPGKIMGYTYPPLPPGLTLIFPWDLPGINYFYVYKSRIPFLADTEVRYKGEPVALVCGPDSMAVHAWVNQFQTIILPQEGNYDLLKSKDVLRHRDLQWGEPPQEESDDRIFEKSYFTGAQDAGDFDPLVFRGLTDEGKLWVSGPSQWPRNLLDGVAKVLGVEKDLVVLHQVPNLAPLDSRLWYPGWLGSATGLLVQFSGHPVKLELQKDEEFFYLPKRPESYFNFKGRLSSQGVLKSLQVTVTINAGAYGLLMGEILDRVILGLGAVYQFIHLEVHAEVVSTHSPPRGPLGSWGEELSQATLGLFIQDLSKNLGMSPLEWQARHLPATGRAFFTGELLKEPPAFSKILDELTRLTDYSRKHGAYEALSSKELNSGDHRFRRGIGLALGFSGVGFIASGTAPASLSLDWEAEGKLVIRSTMAPTEPLQQSHWKNMSSKILGIDPKNVSISNLVKGDTPDGGPATLGRRFMLGERLLEQSLEALRIRMIKTKSSTTMEKSYRRTKHISWDQESFRGIPFAAFSWGGAVAEVEWDTIFSQVRVKKITMIIELGTPVDEPRARATVLSSMRAALGWCLVEKLDWHQGALSHESYRSYRILHSREIPDLELVLLPSGPKSLRKSVGNIPWALIPGAVLTAITQATGKSIQSWPLTRQDFPEQNHDH